MHACSCVFGAKLPGGAIVLNVYISFVGILMRIFPFFHNLAILFSEILIFMINW